MSSESLWRHWRGDSPRGLYWGWHTHMGLMFSLFFSMFSPFHTHFLMNESDRVWKRDFGDGVFRSRFLTLEMVIAYVTSNWYGWHVRKRVKKIIFQREYKYSWQAFTICQHHQQQRNTNITTSLKKLHCKEQDDVLKTNWNIKALIDYFIIEK